jgi:predicted dinucleotide-binding enzyme
LIFSANSIPLIVIAAVSNRLNPSIGPTRWDNVPGTLASLPKWNNQILIDGTNPYHGKAGDFTPADVGNLSTSQLVAALALGARVVKSLNNMTVPNLEADPVVNGARRVAFVSADNDGAKKQVEILLKELGYSVIDLGNLRDGGLIQQAGGPLAGRDFLEIGEYHK